MLQRLLTFLATLVLILLGVTLLWPTKTELVATNLLKGIQDVSGTRLPLLGNRESALKIVDPETIVTSIKEDPSSALSILFNKSNSLKGEELAIEDVIDATNRRRIAEGLVPLKTNPLLIESAKIKTNDMITLQYFEHKSPSGLSVSDLGDKVGYDYLIMGENLALGNFKDAEDLLQAWMDSPGHRANILNVLYQEIGLYVAQGTYEGHRVWFAVQHFGTGRTACPVVSKTLKNEIDNMNVSLNRQQLEIEAKKEEIEDLESREESYEEQVDIFNSMINAYNQMLQISRQKITEYNKQINSFNTCLGRYQNK